MLARRGAQLARVWWDADPCATTADDTRSVGLRNLSRTLRCLLNSRLYLKRLVPTVTRTGDRPRFLVIRIDGIGDLLCITPMLHTLRTTFPGAQIDVLVNRGPHVILEGNEDIDNIYIDYRTRLAGSRLKGLVYTPRRIARSICWKIRGYDIVFVAHYGVHDRALRLSRSIRCKSIVANVEPAFQSIHKKPRLEYVHYKAGEHEVAGVHVLLGAWTDEDPGPLRLNRMCFGAISLGDPNPGPESHIVGLNITSSSGTRRWPMEKFVATASRIAELRQDVVLVVVGLPDDVEHFKIEAKRRRLDLHNRIRFPGTPTLESFIATIARCQMFVGIEGGGMHIAAALGVPQVVLFQNVPSKLVRWSPWKAPCEILVPLDEQSSVATIDEGQVVAAFQRVYEQSKEQPSSPGESGVLR